MDRERAWLPSCNVSWEEWFEGCVELRGEVTSKLFDFWVSFWGRDGGGMELPSSVYNETPDAGRVISPLSPQRPAVPTRATSRLLGCTEFPQSTTQTILLPSPHHRHPNFQYSSSVEPPVTPLNVFILTMFANAVRSVWIATPNLTCRPVVKALLSALGRGIDVIIITSRRLMILEQLVTAGTITELEIWKLRRRYRHMTHSFIPDPEAGLGKLWIERAGSQVRSWELHYYRRSKRRL
ncbi:hypothetical protein D0Z07_0639 [Hyphodiscus hymeniophilus]|uniref:Uncharacterized protein n=1 Tax=Hyphodiscus hymeniophilus TaxID=353542 RepID=A0A9P6VS09_9HELO|nr:hypothetical protein D0Z07_0639 [Hyphodiscus hymeniophilus]